jgi:hypothetical protein
LMHGFVMFSSIIEAVYNVLFVSIQSSLSAITRIDIC